MSVCMYMSTYADMDTYAGGSLHRRLFLQGNKAETLKTEVAVSDVLLSQLRPSHRSAASHPRPHVTDLQSSRRRFPPCFSVLSLPLFLLWPPAGFSIQLQRLSHVSRRVLWLFLSILAVMPSLIWKAVSKAWMFHHLFLLVNDLPCYVRAAAIQLGGPKL